MTSKQGHLERTAGDPRESSLHNVIIKQIDEINPSVRVFCLEIPDGGPTIKFLPGQWLDVYVPTVPKAGGFTITSPPSKATMPGDGGDDNARASAAGNGYLELAVQKSPDNPPAAWLWQPATAILHARLDVRVGGSFIWPPAGVQLASLRKVVLVAGGVGINPLMSMLSALAEDLEDSRLSSGLDVRVLYSMKDPGSPRTASGMLFVERITAVFASSAVKGDMKLFLTRGGGDGGGGGGGDGGGGEEDAVSCCNGFKVPFSRRRIVTGDVEDALGEDKQSSVVYICGVPGMTDEFVEALTSADGLSMEPRRVLFEKWW
ncbi:hypothetical protein B0T22DRAFT_203010 [Podospora appendiculata]|uniref:FAD-binding FR-type domain-containing protein n=1 Tax=Podospora appendiculata TaxID=314037 RepID=A0AAE1C9X4_9PEZI|nr:hypothetical protein B0T22DRAFT_203010 [Podospora appendiculata]